MQRAIDSLEILARNVTEQKEKIRLYGKVCWNYLLVPRLELARKYADTVNFLAQGSKDSLGMYKAIYYYGVIARAAGEYTEALNYLNSYIDYFQRLGDSSRVAGALYQIGSVQSNLGNYEKSLAAYYRLIPIEQKDKNDYSVGYTLNAIGIILKEIRKYQDAEKVLINALVIFDTLNEKRDKSDVLVNLGNLFTDMGRLAEAKRKYQEALLIDRQIGKQTGIAVSLANIAFLYDKMGTYDSALVYHLEALAIRESLPGKEGLARSLIGVGRGYRQIKNYPLAKHYLLKAHALVTQIMSKPMLRDVYENLAHVYSAEGNSSKAYNYHVLYSAVKDSVLSEQTAAQLNELQTKYETGQKDKQILLLENERQVQQREVEKQAALKKAFVGGLVLVSLLAVLLVYIFRQRLKNQQMLSLKDNEIKEMNFNRQMAELEMKALRAQINPHFLFNCMNSINRMILNGESDRASIYLTKFSKLVRLILENAEAPKVSLGSELALLESYIQLEELRFKGKINYKISVDNSIEPESTYLPSMVLQPFVENAIWHGLMHKEGNEKGNISIVVREENDRLLCTIEDNGIGREKAKQLREKSILKSKSMGMKITVDRLKLLNPDNAEQVIWITDLKDTTNHATGTRIEINIPIS
jgi:tetratricopeptide (TPR) repeat protein/two-component sensor histidine kinase